jgi:thiol:disulfide interchange protein DsbA
VYYTQVDLHLDDKMHSALFEAIQTGKLGDNTEKDLRQFFVSKGIKLQDFTKTYESFDVSRKEKWANAISSAYRITAIPAVIVQGPAGIYVTAVKMAGSEDEVVKVVDYLVKMQSASPPTSH